VVSYALPALIAIGLVRHRNRPTANPAARLVRGLATAKSLRVLSSTQPPSGGFLEAAPLTSFVAMSLAGAGLADHPVAVRTVDFLAATVRPDGSWPIDTNLATWVTTLAVGALGDVPADQTPALVLWLLGQQNKVEHPYTHAEAGGWAWTDLPGGVPDADDTAGAISALCLLGGTDATVRLACRQGADWLRRIQNSDGGIPTFCRGWGKLPFDRSTPDLTAHALLAWNALAQADRPHLRRSVARALTYLEGAQQRDGAFIPLWFGNENYPGETNPVYGTARALMALARLAPAEPAAEAMIERGTGFLLGAQNAGGGWGGGKGLPATIEETAVAADCMARVAALACGQDATGGLFPSRTTFRASAIAGIRWLMDATRMGDDLPAAPIGLYFARLWYYEKLYPLIFTLSAARSVRLLPGGPS
jgi:squalene-hopene/tetraprenyl-beta-curcumene cyclase